MQSKEENEAVEILKEMLKKTKIANECGLATKGEFDEDIHALETLLQSREKDKTELEKKDKIIDELENIFYNYQLCEYEITDCTYRKCEYIGDNETPPCKECIKQYFKRKVEE